MDEIMNVEYDKLGYVEIDTSICFISTFSHKQSMALHLELKQQKFTSQPQKLIDFLKGDNDVEVRINQNKLHHISYLLFRLYSSKNNILKLNKGKGYFSHFENYIHPFCSDAKKREMKELKRQVITAKYQKGHVQAEIDAIVAKLNIL